MEVNNIYYPKLCTFLSGAIAGLCVDLTLFPIDTLKTRLQSSQRGIKRSSKSLRLFAGLPAIMIGSAPGAAIFFCSYETVKLINNRCNNYSTFSYMSAAIIGEICACVVRVPCDVLKQRTQNNPHVSVREVFKSLMKAEGFRGLYRGYYSTVLREIPFSVIQFPIWEQLKEIMFKRQKQRKQVISKNVPDNLNMQLSSVEKLSFGAAAFCGATAGGIAGALTTPFDVAKTRIMLAEPNTVLASGSILQAWKTIYKEAKIPGLFAGVIPRVSFLSLGGALFLGAYDHSYHILQRYINPPSLFSV